MNPETAGRPNQKMRTRKDLLQTASRLMRQGRQLTLEEVAAEAMVSRATAYRYFPSIEALLTEAALDIETPQAEKLFGENVSEDPATRLERVDQAFDDMILANERAMRMMLVNALQRTLNTDTDALPARQNRRTPLIEAALEPAKKDFKPSTYKNLTRALALIIGTEGRVVFKDVLRLDDSEARKVKRWAIRALVEAARK
jgi:AcrR family transcriptional regulator